MFRYQYHQYEKKNYLNDWMIAKSVPQGAELIYYSVKKSKNRYLLTKLSSAEYIYRTIKTLKAHMKYN